MDYEKLKTEFDALGVKEQWQWLLDHKSEVEIILDNDNTSVFIKGDDNGTHLAPKADIGDRLGVIYMMELLGFSVQRC